MLLYDVVGKQQFLLLCFRVWPSSFNDYAHQLTPMLRCSQCYLLIRFSVPLCRFFSTNVMWILCLNQTRTQEIKQNKSAIWCFVLFIALLLLGSLLGATPTHQPTYVRKIVRLNCLSLEVTALITGYAHQLVFHLL